MRISLTQTHTTDLKAKVMVNFKRLLSSITEGMVLSDISGTMMKFTGYISRTFLGGNKISCLLG